MGKREENALKIKRQREGQSYTNKEGIKATVINYKCHDEVTIQFEDGYSYVVEWSKFIKGSFKNPNIPNVYGVGYIGSGEYTSKVSGRGGKAYKVWADIFKRSYSSLEQARYPTYKGCSVDDRWHCFQDFAKWYEEQPAAFTPKWAIDKDLLVKGNKIYGPDTCVLLPPEINGFLLGKHRPNKTESTLPIGVAVPQYGGGYISTMMYKDGDITRRKYFGKFKTPEDAFVPFKEATAVKAKRLATKYKDEICERAYVSLMNFEITLDD